MKYFAYDVCASSRVKLYTGTAHPHAAFRHTPALLQQSRETFSQAIPIILVFLMGTRIDAALHPAARRSRQNVNLFLREPLAAGYFAFQTATRQPTMDRASWRGR